MSVTANLVVHGNSNEFELDDNATVEALARAAELSDDLVLYVGGRRVNGGDRLQDGDTVIADVPQAKAGN